MNARFEYASDADPSLSYCLWPYPRPAPAEDKHRSINLLLQSFELAGLHENAYAIVEALRDAIGPFRTVYGVKWSGGRLGWELYFYDYARRERAVSATRVLRALSPWVACDVQVNERLPYFMFSIDLDDDIAAGRRPLDVVHLYLGNPGSTVSSGISWGVRAGGAATLENSYYFFDARSQQAEVLAKVTCTAQFDATTLAADTVVVPELRECHTICVANKAAHDCIYFSGVDTAGLAWFLQRLGYPAPLQQWVRQEGARLDHLRFDVGYDYRLHEGRLAFVKSGYYGVF